jgi:uncharacterized protein YvpB
MLLLSSSAFILSPASALTLPAEHFISGVRSHKQLLPLDCESAAATDWAAYLGRSLNELDFQAALPSSDNPNLGFVGDVNGTWGKTPPDGYGVYAGPVANLLNAYGIPAKAYTGYTLDQLKAKIAENIPVIVWVVGFVQPGTPITYTASDGSQVVVARREHVVIVTGYTDSFIRYTTEGNSYIARTSVFLESWGVLGNMVIVDK